MAQAEEETAPLELPPWQRVISHLAAFILALVYLISGIWKVVDPFAAAVRMAQAQFPEAISLPVAILTGTCETFAGVLILVPRFRRWGAWLVGLSLLAFMVYIGYYYDVLRGDECNCFPWIQRLVGPMFFITDALMIVGTFLAGWWSLPSKGVRNAALIFGAVAVFAGMSYGISAARLKGTKAPNSIQVEGKQFQLHQGRVFIYVFDPECRHCDEAARVMAGHNWGATKLIAMPTRQPQFAVEFVQSTGFRAGISNDVEMLRQTFQFVDPPFAIALENGYQKAMLTRFDAEEPAASLRQLGFIQ
jgi:uncharacterized membrane protein YphA (DoxX/SURF4 family)